MKKTLILISLCLLAFSCKSEYELILSGYDTDEKMKMAFEMYESGRYQKAANLFESLSPLTSGTSRDDTVRYYWGLSNYYFRDYYAAEGNFKTFIDYFPLSPFTENATFLRIDCMYRSTYRYELDQIPTQACMVAIQEYLKDYPDNTHKDACDKMMIDLQQRLDTKAYEGARIYFHMEDYIAATVAFKNILKSNSDNMYREDILYYIAKSSFRYADNSVEQKKKERFMDFVDTYYNFVGEYPTSSYRREIDVLYKRAQRYLGKYNDATEELLAKETANIEKEAKQRLNSEELKVKNFGKAGKSKEELNAEKEAAKVAKAENKVIKSHQKELGRHYDQVRAIARNKRNTFERADKLVTKAKAKKNNAIEKIEKKAEKKGYSEEVKADLIAKAETEGDKNIEQAKAKAEQMRIDAEKKFEERNAAEAKKFETLQLAQ